MFLCMFFIWHPVENGVSVVILLLGSNQEPCPLGYLVCQFEPGQCSKSSRTTCTLRFFRAVRVQTVFTDYAY